MGSRVLSCTLGAFVLFRDMIHLPARAVFLVAANLT